MTHKLFNQFLAHQIDQCEAHFREWVASGYRDIGQHDEWLACREKVMITMAEMRRKGIKRTTFAHNVG